MLQIKACLKRETRLANKEKSLRLNRQANFKELSGMATLLQEQLQGEENELAAEYHSFDDKIKEARKER